MILGRLKLVFIGRNVVGTARWFNRYEYPVMQDWGLKFKSLCLLGKDFNVQQEYPYHCK